MSVNPTATKNAPLPGDLAASRPRSKEEIDRWADLKSQLSREQMGRQIAEMRADMFKWYGLFMMLQMLTNIWVFVFLVYYLR